MVNQQVLVFFFIKEISFVLALIILPIVFPKRKLGSEVDTLKLLIFLTEVSDIIFVIAKVLQFHCFLPEKTRLGRF